MTRLLNSQTFGEATAEPTLLIVPGLFGAGRNWRAIAKRLCRDRQVITVDMRNHAGSFWDAGHSYNDLADDLAQVLAQISGPVDVMGHSMGGKAAMVLALQNPENMNRLIVVDIAPVGYSHSQIINIEAMQNLDISKITRRSEIENMLAAQIKDGPTRAFLAQSLELSESGNRWTLNLHALAQNMDHIIGFPDVSGRFTNAVLFIKGGVSDYILPQYMPKIKAFFPRAILHDIPGAGHWVHAEASRAFIDTVTDFLGS
ncbi:MAG: alpha/beta fold hydrolase [Rhodobacterales bacterium]